MTKVISINQRGTLTLPKDMRNELGLAGSGQVVAESTKDGVLLRPGVTFPVEIYSKERIKEFEKNNQLLAPYAAKIKAALRGKRKPR